MKRDAQTENHRDGAPLNTRRVANQAQGKHVYTLKKNEFQGVIFVGPSLDGADKEYVKVLSGQVDRRKPSFV